MPDTDRSVVLQNARTAMSEKRHNDAIQLLSDLNAVSPNDSQVLSLLGAAYAETGDRNHALDFFEQAAASSPSAPAYFNVATIHKVNGHLEQARLALNEAMKLDPGYERAKQMLSQIEPALLASSSVKNTQQAPPPPQPGPAVMASAPQHAVLGADSAFNPALLPGQQTGINQPLPQAPQVQIVQSTDWPKVIGGGLMVAIGGLIVLYGWASTLSLFLGGGLGTISAVCLVIVFGRWLAQSAGAFETSHWIIMIFFTGLLPSLLMVKGFDLIAQGWFSLSKKLG